MIGVSTTPMELLGKIAGTTELKGGRDNPVIVAMSHIAGASWVDEDSVPWCSAAVAWAAILLDLPCPTSKILRARSWLTVGRPVEVGEGALGFEVVVLKRGGGNQPGPEVLDAPGHVGFLWGCSDKNVMLLGGNQNDSVCLKTYPRSLVLGSRSLV